MSARPKAHMRVVRAGIWLCVDCLMLAVNGDASGIESEERVKQCEAGLDALGPNLVPDFDTPEGHEEFSTRGCDCCDSRLAGELHRFAILGPTRYGARVRRLLPSVDVPRYVRCYDNGGETADRYTIVFTGNYTRRTNGAHVYLGCNAEPTHPQGIGQHGESSGGPIDRPSYKHLGRKVPFSTLPESVKHVALSTYRALWGIS